MANICAFCAGYPKYVIQKYIIPKYIIEMLGIEKLKPS